MKKVISIVAVTSILSTYIAAPSVFSEEETNGNLFVNGDFETGEIAPSKAMGTSAITLEATDEESRSGKYSMKISGRNSVGDCWCQDIPITTGKTYIYSAYFKIADTASGESFPCGWLPGDLFTADKNYYITKDGINGNMTVQKTGTSWDWNRYVTVFETERNVTCQADLILWTSGTEVADYYVDDIYLGELRIVDLQADIPDSVDIPKEGKVTASLENVKAINQLGDNYGLKNAKVEWSLKDAVAGVGIQDNELVVDYTASQQSVCLVANVKISDEDEGIKKEYEIGLNPHDDSNIYVTNAKLNGTMAAGEELSVTYDYRQVNGEADESEIKWYYADTPNGDFKEIADAGGKTFTVTKEYENSVIKAIIYPKSSTGRTAKEVTTNAAAKPALPEARNIKISGEMYIGNKLSASYEFYDINLDEEDKELTKLQWLRKKTGEDEFTPIEGATDIEYELTEDDTDSLLKFRVIPVSKKEPNDLDNNIYWSDEKKGPMLPIAQNLKITKNGDTYYGEYKYFHEYNFPETDTIMNWYSDGVLIGNGANVTVKDTGVVLKFEVIPMCDKAPKTGKTQSVTYNIPKKSTGSSTGGNKGSGGGIYIKPSPVESVDKDKIVEDKKTEIADMEGHWAKNAAQTAVDAGIMQTDENQRFNPSDIVLRKHIVEYAAKTIGLQGKKYTGIFEDVSEEDSYAQYLQACVDAGIISEDIRFRPNDNMTRAELSKVLTKIAEIKNIDSNNEYKGFTDEEIIADWAKPYVKSVVELGLVKGNANGTFNPNGKVNRAEMATVIMRLTDILNGGKA